MRNCNCNQLLNMIKHSTKNSDSAELQADLDDMICTASWCKSIHIWHNSNVPQYYYGALFGQAARFSILPWDLKSIWNQVDSPPGGHWDGHAKQLHAIQWCACSNAPTPSRNSSNFFQHSQSAISITPFASCLSASCTASHFVHPSFQNRCLSLQFWLKH